MEELGKHSLWNAHSQWRACYCRRIPKEIPSGEENCNIWNCGGLFRYLFCVFSCSRAGSDGVSLCSCPGLALKHNLLCWMRNEGGSGRWSKPRSEGGVFGCQVLFCSHIFKMFCNSLTATWMSLYNNMPKLFLGTAKFLSGLSPYAL